VLRHQSRQASSKLTLPHKGILAIVAVIDSPCMRGAAGEGEGARDPLPVATAPGAGAAGLVRHGILKSIRGPGERRLWLGARAAPHHRG
jgi:hypothetical protein